MKTAIVGWRGMVGSVLMQRMAAERDLDHVEPVFFSTSAAGQAGPDVAAAGRARCGMPTTSRRWRSATSSSRARAATTPTRSIRSCVRPAGQGYWIDAASALRMKDDAVIILDPVNRGVIDAALAGRRARLRRWQLHGLADDDGARRAVPRRPRRVDHVDDIPGSLGRRCAEHARARRADGRRARVGGAAAARPGQRDPRHRPRRDRSAPRTGLSARRSSARRSRAA